MRRPSTVTIARAGVISSVLAWIGVRVAYALGWLTPEALAAIIADLSFLAIVLTALGNLQNEQVKRGASDSAPKRSAK